MAPPSKPQQERLLHTFSAAGLVLVCGVIVGGGLLSTKLEACKTAEAKPEEEIDLDDMEAIEASLAYKKAEPKKQPQKKKKAPIPEPKKETFTRDPDAKPIEKKKDEPVTKPDDKIDPLAKYRREDDDEDLDVGKPKDEDLGQFDGSEYGFADVTKGDEYWQHLIADMKWEYPALLDDEAVEVPVGCLHLELDGKIPDIKLRKKSGNDELDDAVERALKTLQKARDDEPIEVPERLHKQTRKWICFKFTV